MGKEHAWLFFAPRVIDYKKRSCSRNGTFDYESSAKFDYNP